MTDREPIRLLIAEDYRPVRQVFARALALEDDIEVVGQAASGAEAVRMAGELRPDVILMDSDMPRLNGVQATRLVAEQFPGVSVVGISARAHGSAAQAMLDAGAVAYVDKLAKLDELVRAVRSAAGRRG